MKQFKPSELPINTVIDDQEEGTWAKDVPGVWFDVTVGVSRVVYDDGPSPLEKLAFPERVHTPSDEFFKDFEILSVPLKVAEKLAIWLDDELERTSADEQLEAAILETRSEDGPTE